MTDEELQYAVEHYKPSDATLQALVGTRLLAVVGPSAVGKTSIIDLAIKTSPLFQQVTDVTTRQKRGSRADAEYTFLTKDQFIEAMKRQEFVQVAMMSPDDLKATRPQDYPIGKIGIMAILSSVIPTFRNLFTDLRTVFIVPSSYEQWMAWFDQHPGSEDEKAKRLAEAKTSLEFVLKDQKTRFILNDTLEQAVARLIQAAEGQSPDAEASAKQLVAEHLAKLQQRR